MRLTRLLLNEKRGRSDFRNETRKLNLLKTLIIGFCSTPAPFPQERVFLIEDDLLTDIHFRRERPN